MSIRDHLRQGEAIISDHNPYYATSFRVIHYEEKDGNEELSELPYSRVTSVEVVKLARHNVMIAGTMLVVGGAILAATWNLIGSWLSIVAGIGVVIYGGIGREAYYQFRAEGMDKEEEAKWRLTYWGSGSFVRTVQTVMGDGFRN